MKERNFIYRMLSDDKSQPSNSRVLLATVIVTLLTVTVKIAWCGGQVLNPPDGWLWIIGILSGVVTTGYMKSAYIAGKGCPDVPTNQPPQ